MIRRLLRLLRWWPTEKMLVVASALGLMTLGIMVAGVVLATPLPVIASMSVAQGLGVLAGLMFALSVAADAGRCESK